MKRNVGKADKAVRLVVGVAIIAAGVYSQSWWGAIGAVPILTARMGWCPPYSLLGINTCATRSAGQA